MFNLLNLFKKKHYYPKPIKPNHTGYDLLIAEEITQIREALKNHISPTIPNLIENSGSQLVWRIGLKNKNDQYMKLDRSKHDNGYITYIDTELFYLLCLNFALKNAIPKDIGKIRKDLLNGYNYIDAEQAFDYGQTNPVPLANINIASTNNKLCISFIDGITQTIWLIANEALAFPIYTHDLNSANPLNDIAGLIDEPIPVKKIFVNSY